MRAIPILMLTALALLSACGSEDPSAGMRESADRARRSCEEARQMGKQVTALTGKKSDESSIRELCDLADQFEDMARESEQRAGGEAGASDCPAAVVGTVGGCSKAEIKARGDAARALRGELLVELGEERAQLRGRGGGSGPHRPAGQLLLGQSRTAGNARRPGAGG